MMMFVSDVVLNVPVRPEALSVTEAFCYKDNLRYNLILDIVFVVDQTAIQTGNVGSQSVGLITRVSSHSSESVTQGTSSHKATVDSVRLKRRQKRSPG